MTQPKAEQVLGHTAMAHDTSLNTVPLTYLVIACWASTGYASSTCAGVESALRQCMDGPQPPPKKRNNINHHLSRFKRYLEGNTGNSSKK